MTANPREPSTVPRSVVGPAAAIAVAHLSINAGPLMLGAVADGLQIDTAAAGLLATLELVAFGVATLLVAPFVTRIPLRTAAIAALLLTAAANLLSIWCGHNLLLGACRVASGFGGGMLAAVAYATVSGMANPERQFAKCYATLFLSGMLCYLLIPPFQEAFQHRGVFGFIAGASLLLLPTLLLLPRRLGGSAETRQPTVSLRQAKAILLVAGAMLVTFSDGLVWPMTERIGASLGLGTATIGLILAIGVLTGLSGLFLAGKLGRRAGSIRPILIGIWGTAIAGLVITHAGITSTFVLGVLLKNPFYFLALPYIMAVAARMDSGGRVSALLGGLLPVGAGLGPWPAGWVADHAGFALIGWLGIGAVLLATIPLVNGARRA